MKKLATIIVLFVLSTLIGTQAQARRGNPAVNNNGKYQFYLLDSDDNDPRTPSYNFVDTLFDPTSWKRVAFTYKPDTVSMLMTPPDSGFHQFYAQFNRFPYIYFTRYGIMGDTFSMATPDIANNTTIPTGGTAPFRGFIAPLWGNMEFRHTGDSSKVFYRMNSAKDSFYVTYYNLFLNGTNGNVRATFQVIIAKADSSVSFNYRSFDGSYAGVAAAAMFQRMATIGVQNIQGVWGTCYLDRGNYLARSYSSQIYAKDLHTGLCVKFFPWVPNFIRMKTIDFPPNDGYEVSSQNFTPVVTIDNLKSQSRTVYFQNKIINLVTGAQVYSRTDSFVLGFNDIVQKSGSQFQALQCGYYRLISTCWLPELGTLPLDTWDPDNTLTRDFVYLNNASAPYYDDYVSLDPCYWHYSGVNWVDNNNGMYDSPGPSATGAVVLNRRNVTGNVYPNDLSADTLTFAPINLGGKSNVWLTLSYQRGARTDSTIAGVTNRTVVGPEMIMLDSNKNIIRGDSLIVEVTPSSASKLNPAEASWVTIAKLYGGLDTKTQKFRVQIPQSYLHDHTRVRFRLAARNHTPLFVPIPPIEDDDNWVLDAFEINAAVNGQTDFEPVSVDLGARLFTHIPRDVKAVLPRVTIGNNALVTNLASYPVRLIVNDALNREVYHRTQSVYAPAAHSDTTISFAPWQIEGSQGGIFTTKIFIEQNFNEMRRANDTATFNRTLFIDNVYAYDDGTSDTSGSMTVADPHFFIDFQPMTTDSLRGFDFFHVSSTGTTNWTVTVKDTNGHTIATRSFSYNTLQRGFQRANISPIYTIKDSVYRIEFNMTQGFGLGGDGSRGLVLKTAIEKGPTPKYTGLYSSLLKIFRDQNGVPYLTSDSLARNGAGGGPLLPMVRFVYTGSATFLPIELSNFDARRNATGEVLLDFRTAKEENVANFQIERQTENGWAAVSTLPARNARLGSDYSAIDNNAPFTATTYRLNEIDLDGSKIVAGYANVDPFNSSTPLSVTILENPASSHIRATLAGVIDGAQVRVYDMLGKVVLTSNAIGNGILDLDASSLAAGKYTIDVVSGSAEVRASIVLQK
jgi:hypothetical protein